MQVYNSGGQCHFDLNLCQTSGLAKKLLEGTARAQANEAQLVNWFSQCHSRSQCRKPGLEQNDIGIRINTENQ